MSRQRTYGLIVLIALVVRAIGFAVYGIDYSGDFEEYDRIAVNLVQGHGYSLSQSAPFHPTTQREPLYPLFLASLYAVAGRHAVLVVILQCLMGAFACLLIYEIALRVCADRRVAWTSALLNAGYVPIVIFNFRMQSETLAIVLMAIIAYSLVRIVSEERSWADHVVVGIAMGLLMLDKLAFQFLPLVAVPAVVLMSHGRRRVWKALVCVLLSVLFVAPWLMRNHRLHGTYAFGHSVRLAANLYTRVADNGIKGPLEMRTGFYHDLLQLERQGIPVSTINAAYVQKALQIIREHPFRYLGGVFLEIKDLWRFSVYKEEIDVTGPITLQGTQGKFFLFVKHVFLAANFAILTTALLGFLMKTNYASFMVMSLVGYSTLFFALISCALPRHNVPVLQLMIVFSAYFLVRLYDWFHELAVGLEPRPVAR